MANTIKILVRNDTGANWASKNPVMLKGEQGYDSTANRFKVGDGVKAWNDLPYLADDDTKTTYNTATTSAAGLMSAADKSKLDGLRNINNFKLRKKIFYYSELSSGINFIVPDGVYSIKVNGSAGGGGGDYFSAANNMFTYYSGWSGAQIAGLVLKVKPNDILMANGGKAGTPIFLKTAAGQSTDGENLVLKLNDIQIFNLAGGKSPKNGRGHSGNQTNSSIVGNNSEIIDRGYLVEAHQPIQIFATPDGDDSIAYGVENLMRITSIGDANLLFPSFGRGCQAYSANFSYNHGFLSFEYVEPVS